MVQQDYDVLVVGARVAGSTLAALLGDAGYRALLVDRASFPSPTLSTHYFRGGQTLAVLDRLGLLQPVLALGSPALPNSYWHFEGGARPSVRPAGDPGTIGYALSVRRLPFDHLLVERARRCPTVDVWEQTRATTLLWEDDRVVGARLTTPAGEQAVRARIVIGADGRQSFVARAVQAPVEESAAPTRAIYYCYVRGFPGPDGGPPDGAEFSLLGDEMAYVFPSDDGTTCIAWSINLADYGRVRTNAATGFRAGIARHRGLADRFAAAQSVDRLLGCGPELNYVRVPGGAGWALVGDAGLHQDPWSGQGMDMASRHAEFLAEALIGWFSGSMTEAAALTAYHERRNEHGLEKYRNTVQFAQDLRHLAARFAPQEAS